MNHRESIFCEQAKYEIDTYLPENENDTVIREILDGLTSGKKCISSKYFYDAAGSKLFEKITRLPEYYLTRIEKNLLKEVSPRIADKLINACIIELGSGDCSKISILLHAVPAAGIESIRYIPVDVSRSAIEGSAAVLLKLFPGLHIHGMVADFTQHVSSIP